MRTVFIFLFIASVSGAQTIATRSLSPGAPIKIALSPAITTTLLFPGPLSGTFGLGLVTSQSGSNGGSVQVEHPDGSNLLVLHALNETAHVLATVLLDGVLYVLDLQSAPSPDVAITLIKGNPSTPQAQTVTPEQVKADRIKYDPELMLGYLRRSRDAVLLRPLYPDLYQGYASRQVQYSSDSGTVKTTVKEIHRFSKEDATVLRGTVQNESSQPVKFDGRPATVEVANEIYPIKLLDCLRPIPPGATVPIDVVIQGDIDGGRSNVSINNEFRIILPEPDGMQTVWSLKNGHTPHGAFRVPAPSKATDIPLTQTGKPMKENQ